MAFASSSGSLPGLHQGRDCHTTSPLAPASASGASNNRSLNRVQNPILIPCTPRVYRGPSKAHNKAVRSHVAYNPGGPNHALYSYLSSTGKKAHSKLRVCRASAAASEAATAAESEAAASTFFLGEEEKGQFDEQGYLVLPGFASETECNELQRRMGQLVDAFDPTTVSVFSSRNQTKLTQDYFLNSGGNISFFFEENAFDEAGNLKQPKELSINKVGHALHDIDPVFRSFSRSPKMAALTQSIGFRKPLPVQSMYIFKQPGIGGEVVPHQDSSFIYTEPMSCVGFWLALEDATAHNGCLWALPGSQKDGLSRRFIKTKEGGVTFDKQEVPEYDISKFIPLAVPKGSLVVLHGLLVHFSYENKSPLSRHAYTVHVIESEGSYSDDNWLQRQPTDPPFEPLLVK